MMMQLLFTSVRNRLSAIHTFNISFFILILSASAVLEERIRGTKKKKVQIISLPVTPNSLREDLFVLDYSHMVKVNIDISYSS